MFPNSEAWFESLNWKQVKNCHWHPLSSFPVLWISNPWGKRMARHPFERISCVKCILLKNLVCSLASFCPADGLMLPFCYLSLKTFYCCLFQAQRVGQKYQNSIEFLWFSEVAAKNLRKVGIIPDLLSILKRFLHNDKICFSCCAVLWSLAVSGE